VEDGAKARNSPFLGLRDGDCGHRAHNHARDDHDRRRKRRSRGKSSDEAEVPSCRDRSSRSSLPRVPEQCSWFSSPSLTCRRSRKPPLEAVSHGGAIGKGPAHGDGKEKPRAGQFTRGQSARSWIGIGALVWKRLRCPRCSAALGKKSGPKPASDPPEPRSGQRWSVGGSGRRDTLCGSGGRDLAFSETVAISAPTKTVKDNPSRTSPAANSGDTRWPNIGSSTDICTMRACRFNVGVGRTFHCETEGPKLPPRLRVGDLTPAREVVSDRLAICRRRLHLLDHMNDRQANPRVGDPQECPNEPRAQLGVIRL